MVQGVPSSPYVSIRPRTFIPDSFSSRPSREEGKRKRASVACAECKRRRVRCSSGIPCIECLNHEHECIYNKLADKRRKVAAKNTKEELQYYRTFAERFLRAIRLGERTGVDNMVDIIRAGATNDEVLSAVSCCLNQDQNQILTRMNSTPNLVGDFPLPDMAFDIFDEGC